MSFLAELQQGRQLRKVVTDDRSSGLRAGFSTSAEMQHMREMWLACSAEAWESLLGDATFESFYVPISWAEGAAMIALCERVDRWKQKVGQEAWAAHDDAAAAAGVSADDLEPLADLEGRLDAQLAAGGLGEAFAKTSLRSAKDVVTAKLKNAFTRRLEGCAEELPMNDKVALLVQLGTELMKVSSGKEIIATFIQSERVLGDLSQSREAGEDAWSMSVVLRRWFNVQTSLEFRCFVHRNQMTAMTQYNYFVHYPAVAENKSSILPLVEKFFEDRCRKPLRELGSYVIDFAIYSEDLARLDPNGYPLAPVVRCIEVNPFFETTGAALFNWTCDRSLLEGSAAPDSEAAAPPLAPTFEFRTVETVPTRFELETEYLTILGTTAAGPTGA